MPNKKIVILSAAMNEDSQFRAKEANRIFNSLYPHVKKINIYCETPIIERDGILHSAGNYLDKNDEHVIFFIGPFEGIEQYFINVKSIFDLSKCIVPVVTEQDNFEKLFCDELDKAGRQSKHIYSLHTSVQPSSKIATDIEREVEIQRKFELQLRLELKENFFTRLLMYEYINFNSLRSLRTLPCFLGPSNRRLLTSEDIKKLCKYLDGQKQNEDIVFAFRTDYLGELQSKKFSFSTLIDKNECFAEQFFSSIFPKLKHAQQEQLIEIVTGTLFGKYLATHKMEARDTACNHFIEVALICLPKKFPSELCAAVSYRLKAPYQAGIDKLKIRKTADRIASRVLRATFFRSDNVSSAAKEQAHQFDNSDQTESALFGQPALLNFGI